MEGLSFNKLFFYIKKDQPKLLCWLNLTRPHRSIKLLAFQGWKNLHPSIRISIMSDKINNVHDKFFRASMGHQSVAIDFIQHHFPKKISQALNTNSLKLLQQSFIKKDLQEHFSDLVFSCKLADKPAYLTLLIEHQSSPDKMMAFRIHQYLFGLLSNYRKQHPNKLLPAVYALVFYHGKTTPYPYSLSL